MASIMRDVELSTEETRLLSDFLNKCCSLAGVTGPDDSKLASRDEHIQLENIRVVETLVYLVPSMMRSVMRRNHMECMALTEKIQSLASSFQLLSALDGHIDDLGELP
jgi:hypothetical protein